METKIRNLAKDVLILADKSSITITTAESCTGGMIAAALTDIPGSSTYFDRGFITYSNTAKTDMLNVPPDMISRHGAVSGQVAEAMAQGASMAIGGARENIAVSVTGIAGPAGSGGDSLPSKPVGLVWFGLAVGHKVNPAAFTEKHIFDGGRDDVRKAATYHALKMLKTAIEHYF